MIRVSNKDRLRVYGQRASPQQRKLEIIRTKTQDSTIVLQ